MHDISPVLSGTYDDPNYAAWRQNVQANAADPLVAGATAVDASAAASTASSSTTATSVKQDPQYARNGRLDRTGADAGEQSFSFDDFLDMVNPLQHIPIASSIYREATGESINPVSRITGDILYGGVFGVASAVMSAFSAVGDSIVESQTGHDGLGTVIASLFGDDLKKAGDTSSDVQLASAQTQTQTQSQTQARGVVATTANNSNAPIQFASNTITGPTVTPASIASTSASSALASSASASSEPATTTLAANTPGMHFMPLNRTGSGAGVNTSNMQSQNLAMALAQGSHGTRIGNTIYANGLMNSVHPMVTGTAVAASTPQTPAQRLAAMTQQTQSQSAYANSPQLAALLGQMTSGKNVNPILSAAPTTASVNNTLSLASGKSSIAQLAAQASPAVSPTTLPAAAANVPTTPTIPDNLGDDPIVLHALGLYRKVGSSNAPSGSTVNVTN